MRGNSVDDLFQTISELESKIRRLENSSQVRVHEIDSGVSTFDLGSFDGESITGVRITGAGFTTGTGAASYLRLRPNNISSMQSTWDQHYVFNTPGGAIVHSAFSQGDIAANGALPIWQSGFGTSAAVMTFDGVFYTPTVMGRRVYEGSFTIQDRLTNANNRLMGRHNCRWDDAGTEVTSLTLALDAGTFQGRISTQVIL